MRLGETIFLTSLKAGSKHSFPDSTNKYSFQTTEEGLNERKNRNTQYLFIT